VAQDGDAPVRGGGCGIDEVDGHLNDTIDDGPAATQRIAARRLSGW